ncbi:MAG: hypothetical protein ACFFC7_12390 [Candidatus Hermodarchaeota archaeon]
MNSEIIVTIMMNIEKTKLYIKISLVFKELMSQFIELTNRRTFNLQDKPPTNIYWFFTIPPSFQYWNSYQMIGFRTL